ncbi:MAG TPA: SPFH domain-containing protein, partial [Turneriella sp.]|nr:SPFH domain-containing protein [Turneriella sp.]
MENLLPLGAVALVFVLLSLKVINQYEQGLVFTFGKYTGMKHPGLRFLVPIVQRMVRVDMRIRTLDVMKQQIMSKDNVPVHVNAAIFYKVSNPEQAIIEVQDYQYAIAQYGQTALRDVIGGMNLDTLLTERQE